MNVKSVINLTQKLKGDFTKLKRPQQVGLGLLIHKKTRNKKLVNILADLNLSIDYDNIIRILTDIADAVCKRMEENNGVYVPPQIMPGSPVYFAVDNCDFRNDTPGGKNVFHGTAQIVYQQSSNVSAPSKLKVERNQKRALSKDPFPPSATCSKPIPPNQRHPSFVPDMKDVDLYRKWDSIWFLTKSLKKEGTENNTPTWAAYNSLITKALPVTIFCGLPLYPAPPTDWTSLYAALQICQNISTITYPAGKTIISLDLQLYSKALQLQSRNEVNCNFVFRIHNTLPHLS